MWVLAAHNDGGAGGPAESINDVDMMRKMLHVFSEYFERLLCDDEDAVDTGAWNERVHMLSLVC